LTALFYRGRRSNEEKEGELSKTVGVKEKGHAERERLRGGYPTYEKLHLLGIFSEKVRDRSKTERKFSGIEKEKREDAGEAKKGRASNQKNVGQKGWARRR